MATVAEHAGTALADTAVATLLYATRAKGWGGRRREGTQAHRSTRCLSQRRVIPTQPRSRGNEAQPTPNPLFSPSSAQKGGCSAWLHEAFQKVPPWRCHHLRGRPQPGHGGGALPWHMPRGCGACVALAAGAGRGGGAPAQPCPNLPHLEKAEQEEELKEGLANCYPLWGKMAAGPLLPCGCPPQHLSS